MKTVTEKVNLFLHMSKYSPGEYEVKTYDMSEFGDTLVTSREVDVMFAIPEDFDPINAEVESLKAVKKKIEAEAFVKAQNIEEQIQRLLCIEHKVEAGIVY